MAVQNEPTEPNEGAEQIEEHDYDVLVIGAGGAGLRAAIAAREAGMRTAVICKSLFGKAHTVMAEGGIAASMGNVNSNDSWQVHFRDTMQSGGKLPQLNGVWRELHAQEAPERVSASCKTWGARLRPHERRGAFSQRNFGGHDLPAAGPRRRPHRPGNDPHACSRPIVSLHQDDMRETGVYEARMHDLRWSARSRSCCATSRAPSPAA